jgi:hypothetical protein
MRELAEQVVAAAHDGDDRRRPGRSARKKVTWIARDEQARNRAMARWQTALMQT